MKQLFVLILFVLSLTLVKARETYTIQGVVCDEDRVPMKNVAVNWGDGDVNICATDDSGRFVVQTETLPVRLSFNYVGYPKKIVFADKHTCKSGLSVIMEQNVVIDFFDERKSLTVSSKEYDSWGEIQGILVGRVFFDADKEPLIGACVDLKEKKQVIGGVITDIDGNFYLPIKQLPAKVEVRYVGCETLVFKVTKRNIKKFQRFFLKQDENVYGCPEIIF